MWRWRRPANHRLRLDQKMWADLISRGTDESSARAAHALELRAEAERLADVLGEPTVLLGTIRVPAYLAPIGSER